MGRPREHDERTATALLDAAEQIVAAEGMEALSVRRVAHGVNTTTRAVYSLFGSKDGLVSALGARAFNLLSDALDALPVTGDPAGDLVEAACIFRRFALGHPALFAIGFQGEGVTPEIDRQFCDAQESALARLHGRIERLAQADTLGARTVSEATVEFHGLCEGFVGLEVRGWVPIERAEWLWRDAFSALIAGWCAVA